MGSPLLPPPQARRILELFRSDRAAARAAMAEHSLAAQVALICETPANRRGDLLELAAQPERLIPALPAAELCFTVTALGLEDAAWILEHGTAEQITTCVDLDAWRSSLPDRKSLGRWLVAFAEAGDATLLRASEAIDLEAWVLHLMERVYVELKPDGNDSWAPPEGGLTVDGQFYIIARKTDDDLEELMALLRVLFQQNYWFYFRLLQGVIWELPTETEEWALRWRTGRLQDLGFPPVDEAKGIYAHLDEDERRFLPGEDRAWQLEEWPLPVWMPNFPATAAASQSLFRAFAELTEEERRPFLLEFLTVANRTAVADDLPLGEAESLPAALTKASWMASAGLDYLQQEHGLTGPDVLRRVSQARLFQVGFQVELSLGRVEAPVIPPLEGGADEEGPATEA